MDLKEIKRESERLEGGATSYATVEKLALLYIVREYLDGQERTMAEYSYEARSDFMEAVSGAPLDKVFEILDEHFDAILAIYPKEHAQVIRRIKETKRQS